AALSRKSCGRRAGRGDAHAHHWLDAVTWRGSLSDREAVSVLHWLRSGSAQSAPRDQDDSRPAQSAQPGCVGPVIQVEDSEQARCFAQRAASGAVLMNGDRRTVTRLVRHASSLRSVEPLALREQHALIGGDAKLEARRDAPCTFDEVLRDLLAEEPACRLLEELEPTVEVCCIDRKR